MNRSFFCFAALLFCASCENFQDEPGGNKGSENFSISGFESEYLRYPDFNTRIRVVVSYDVGSGTFYKNQFSGSEPSILLLGEMVHLLPPKQKELLSYLEALDVNGYKSLYNQRSPAFAVDSSYCKTTFYSQGSNVSIMVDTSDQISVPAALMDFCNTIYNRIFL